MFIYNIVLTHSLFILRKYDKMLILLILESCYMGVRYTILSFFLIKVFQIEHSA